MGTIKTYLDRPSLWAAIITAILIVIIVITGIFVWIFADELVSRITLITLIIVLCILGLCSLSYLEFRKRTVQKQDKSAAKNGYLYNNLEPSAPSWESSNRSTLPA